MVTFAITLLIAAALVAVVYYIRGAESNAAALNQRNATLQAEQERRHATEKAEAQAAAARKVVFDEKARKVTDADAAARLLREASDSTPN